MLGRARTDRRGKKYNYSVLGGGSRQLTRPGYQLSSIHTQHKRKDGIEVDIEAVGPLHCGWPGARLLEHMTCH